MLFRSVDPTNGRRFLLYITADGDRVVEALRNPVGDVEALLLNGLEEDQRKVLIETLRACRDSLGEAPRVRDRVTVRVREPVADQEPVTCVIPGHDRDGRELVVDELRVDAAPLAFEFSERCAYEATFAYSSADE